MSFTPRFREIAHRRLEAAHGADQTHRLRDHVEGADLAGLHRADAHDDRIERVRVAARDGLQRGDHLRRRHHRVYGEVRHGAVTAASAHRDRHLVGRGHHRPRPHRHLPRRQPGPVMHRVNLVDGKALEETLFHHHFAAAAAFFGGLEDEHCGAGKIARRGEVARCPQQHGGMAVVAAGMHPAGVRRPVLEAVGLVDRQAIHVGAQAHGPAAALAADHADHAGLREAAVHLARRTSRARPPPASRCGSPRRRARGGHGCRAGFR